MHTGSYTHTQTNAHHRGMGISFRALRDEVEGSVAAAARFSQVHGVTERLPEQAQRDVLLPVVLP